MDNNNKYDMQDLVVSAVEQRPDDFAQGFNSLMVDRLNIAIENRKQEIAQNMFADPNEEETEEETDGDDDAEYDSEVNSEE